MFEDMTEYDKKMAKRALLWLVLMLAFVIVIGGGGDELELMELR